MAERTKGTICLGPTANFQESYKLLCLKLARRVVRKQFKELPIPVSVIKWIAKIAERENQGDDLIFTDRNGNEILDHNVEGDYIATSGVDIETGNETGGDDRSDNQNKNQNKNENENESGTESNNQSFITDNDEQPGVFMESGEGTPQVHAETQECLRARQQECTGTRATTRLQECSGTRMKQQPSLMPSPWEC
jgi:hypothetical protein